MIKQQSFEERIFLYWVLLYCVKLKVKQVPNQPKTTGAVNWRMAGVLRAGPDEVPAPERAGQIPKMEDR